jgi:dipeptidyl aminopeptidase/acylaminoacyl peptidase
MTLRKIHAGLVGAALFTLISIAATAAQTSLTPEQALDYRRASDLHFSPDGTKLAFVVLSYRDDRAPHIWLMDVPTGAARDITPSKKSERSPQWSPDGKSLAFLSNRNGKTQIYVMAANGTDATASTSQKNAVEKFHWSPDGRSLAYLAKDDDAQDEDSGPQVADQENDLARLWVLDVASKRKQKLTTGKFRVDDFQWQDASHLLMSASAAPSVEEFNDAVYRISMRDGASNVLSRPPQPFGSLVVSPSGNQFVVLSTDTNGPFDRDIFLGSTGNGVLHDASAPLGLSVAQLVWHRPSSLWARVVDGFRNRIVEFRPGAAAVSIDLPLSVEAFDVSPDGSIAFAGGDFDHLSEIYLRSRDGGVRQLTHLQQGWDGIHLASTTIFKIKSFDGTEIESALMKPSSLPASGKMPLVLLVHGGPSSNFGAGYGWETAWGQMLASHGYEVLMVNPRGSDGYSEDFAKANRGDWGGGDYKDLMAVLDFVTANGETDPDRLGIGGWSYGAEMSERAIGQTNRFKAAVAGAGVFDQAAEFETERSPQDDEWYFGTPWDHPDVFARNSPSTFIRNARTPTLIFDGMDDANNPVGQSKGLYRALKHYGVETEMVLYPGEGHSPRRWDYNVDMFRRILDWYDRHLKNPK